MTRFWLVLAAAGLAACSGESVIANDGAGANLPDIEREPPDEMTGAGDAEGSSARPVDGADAVAASIPQFLQGRWALAPADCDPGRSDAKGLMVVLPGELRFYESRARLVKLNDSSRDSISGDFAFTGEGQSWTRYQSLKRQGETLTRTETEPVASYTYARCR